MTDRAPDADDTIDPLTRIAIRCGTDKWGLHFYTPVYHALFGHLRDRPLRLLEIGVGGNNFNTLGGASLAMWAEYFPNARVVGIDIAEKKLKLDPRITVHQGSQDDPAFLARVSEQHGPFDIVIDDGSHIPKHVVASFNALFPRLADGGLYIIEDVQTAFWPRFGGSVLDGGATMHLARTMIDHLHHAEIAIVQPTRQISDLAKTVRSFRAYHNILVIEKGDNTEPSNLEYRLDNVHAARAVRAMERELAQTPTAAGYANLIVVLTEGRNLARARALAEQALERWPDHPELLFAAHHAAEMAGDAARKLEFLRRLMVAEPGNTALRPLLQQCEAEANAAGAARR